MGSVWAFIKMCGPCRSAKANNPYKKNYGCKDRLGRGSFGKETACNN